MMPLPWIDRIFEKCSLIYGRAFLDRWKDLDIEAVKSDWAHELDGMERWPGSIKFALENLPEKPPTVLEFRSICRRAPAAPLPQIEAPRADPARVKAALAGLGPAPEKIDGRDWARRILARVEAGEVVSAYAKWCAQEALRSQCSEDAA